jgi:glucose-1-phosphate thymidylyltransferase
VGGRPILERLLRQLAEIPELEHVFVVTNAKFADRFREFAAGWPGPFALSVVDDGTTSEDDRLGAIGDLALVLEREGVDEDLLVSAGDSVFSEGGLAAFARLGLERQAPVIAVSDVGDLEAIKRYSAITTDADDRIVAFEEKPKEPETTLAGVALYFYPRSSLPLIGRYLKEGNNPDQPGRLVEWMYERTPFYTWRIPGRWFDIGTHETLAEADREFSQS